MRTAKSQGIRPGRASILPPCSTSVPFPPKSMPRSALPILQTVRTYLSKRMFHNKGNEEISFPNSKQYAVADSRTSYAAAAAGSVKAKPCHSQLYCDCLLLLKSPWRSSGFVHHLRLRASCGSDCVPHCAPRQTRPSDPTWTRNLGQKGHHHWDASPATFSPLAPWATSQGSRTWA